MPETHALVNNVRNERKTLGEIRDEFAEYCGIEAKTSTYCVSMYVVICVATQGLLDE